MFIIGLDAFGDAVTNESPLGSVKNITYVAVSNIVIDELQIKEEIDNPINSLRDNWGISHRLLCRFRDSLSGGNLENNGLEISSFCIKRRKYSELTDTVLAYTPFENNTNFVYTDYSQANEKYIYSITPIAENGSELFPNQTNVESSFVGHHLVFMDTSKDIVIPLDKSFGNTGNVDVTPNKGRIQLETLNKYPKVIYTNQDYKTFSITAVLIPEDGQRSITEYKKLEAIVDSHRPVLVKSSNGMIYAGDIVFKRGSSPMNSYVGYDWLEVDLDFTELMSVNDFMKLNIKNLT